MERGDLIILVGENGVGKSTLLHHFFNQTENEISFVEQPPMDSFYDRKLQTIHEIFSTSNRTDIRPDKFYEFWKLFQLDKKSNRYQSMLSGGEGQALKLCLGLCLDREIFFLDEPSQFLDTASRDILNSILGALRAEGRSVLMVEHDLSWVKEKALVYELAVIDHTLRKKSSWNT